ncbi:MAG: tRNA (adenosine(37)-N6)-threonylcarbamoyltransferase complex transferase subunit TsaD [Cyclobacteriaceae bacterium]|nr:tRNA (adenosine(37)-N6)-threonylcarbamoyltransferase complex transferase subunit TsaD [Cyclobacteriaceae bacterium]
MYPTILAIESSCDETSASIISNGKVLNNIIATQSIHEIYGGVVPELASRAHQQKIVPVVRRAMEQANVAMKDLDAVAFTQGPGLLGALLVGASFAKGLAIGLDVPLIGIHHMKAHILAHFIDDPKPKFPFLCLTISGGHTQIVIVRSAMDMEVIGQTQDDAVGEAFDKCAKMLGLPYPGGPVVDQLAAKGDPQKFKFPKTAMAALDYSFSGIKTAFLYFLNRERQKNPTFVEENMNDLCASLQDHLISMLMEKLVQASEQTDIQEIAIAGGVSANSGLRTRLLALAEEKSWNLFIPAFEYCTDNAAMIAMAAHFKYIAGEFDDLEVTAMARMTF